MQKARYKIAIIGNGKLAKAIVSGLLLSPNISPSDILVIKRVIKKDEHCFFKSLGVNVSTKMKDVSTASCIILAVTPLGSDYVVRGLSKVSLINHKVISFVSGLLRNQIRKDPTKYRIIQATCNTNIAYRKGIICATGQSTVLSDLGQVFLESPKRITRSIVTIGSGNGFDCRALYIGYISSGTQKSLREWLTRLLAVVKDRNQMALQIEDEYAIIRKYLRNKSKVFCNNQFTYGRTAGTRSRITMQSTIEALLSMDGDINLDSIRTLFDTVVTKGGCTEKGINMISSVEDLLSFEKLEEAFLLVWQRAILFKKDVRTSIAKTARLTVFERIRLRK
ncbi:MAG: NAD(P)-binding domain-containing protein [Patescibacteria group bacterium]